MHTRTFRLVDGLDLFGDLRGVFQDEVGGDGGDAIAAPIRRGKIDAFAVSEPLLEFTHDGDIGTGEPENGLPVVANGEQLRARRALQQCLQQIGSEGEMSWNSSTRM